MKQELGSRALVDRALQGLETPRAAVGPLAVHFCAALSGVTLRQYTTNARVLADCVVRYYDRFRPDAVWLSADTWVTAEAMGASVDFPDDDQPMGGTGQPAVMTSKDIDRLPPPDPGSQGRWPLMLEALASIRERIGQDACIAACFDQYPFSLACALMGINGLMVKLVDDPPMVEALMERCGEFALAYARALDRTGADLLSGGDSPAGLISPAHYRQIALPAEQRLIGRIHAACDAPVSLHICGDTTHILAGMGSSGADILELDCQTDLATACALLGPEVVIWGNLDAVGLLAQSTAVAVGEATRSLLQTYRRAGHRRFVVSSGCTLAVETPAENLEAMFAVARQTDLPNLPVRTDTDHDE